MVGQVISGSHLPKWVGKMAKLNTLGKYIYGGWAGKICGGGGGHKIGGGGHVKLYPYKKKLRVSRQEIGGDERRNCT